MFPKHKILIALLMLAGHFMFCGREYIHVSESLYPAVIKRKLNVNLFFFFFLEKCNSRFQSELIKMHVTVAENSLNVLCNYES